VLFLDQCQISSIPDPIFAISSLKKLYLPKNKIQDLPDRFFSDFQSLEFLDISWNFLETISPKIEQLKQLEHLNAGCNLIASVPAEFSKCFRLKFLILHGNFISNFPSKILKAMNLQQLKIFHNPMPEITQRILCNFVEKGSELDLSNMEISDLPAEISLLSHLQTLRIAQNILKKLSVMISQLTNLKFLDVSNNFLEEIPAYIYQMPNLERISLAGNAKLQHYPEEINALRNFMKEREKGKNLPKSFRKIKLMFVGSENVGKTSLKNCLQAKNIR
jgi:Leucine-rich repeat (LRR) protein